MKYNKTHVIVIGAGYAGLLASVRLAMNNRRHQPDVQITLINPSADFIERPRLHQFAANQFIKRRPIEEVLKETGVLFIQAAVTSIEVDRKEVVSEADGKSQRLAYDYLMYTAGSTFEQDSVPGVRQNAYTLNPAGPHSAAALRSVLPELTKQGGHLVVVGGGPTGIESAAEFAESYPGLRVTLVAQGDLGGWLGGKMQFHIQKTLARLGVELRDQTTVERLEQNQLITKEGETLGFDVCLWAGGFVAPSLARESGLAVNERGQVLTDATMRSISNPWIYAAGDSAQPVEAARMPVRMAAYTAVITGAHAADSMSNAIHGRPQKPLNFAYLGQGIALGRRDAVGFNNFPDDTPKEPVFTGMAAVIGREFFINVIGGLPIIERRLPGLHFWPGRGKARPVASSGTRKVRRQPQLSE